MAPHQVNHPSHAHCSALLCSFAEAGIVPGVRMPVPAERADKFPFHPRAVRPDVFRVDREHLRRCGERQGCEHEAEPQKVESPQLRESVWVADGPQRSEVEGMGILRQYPGEHSPGFEGAGVVEAAPLEAVSNVASGVGANSLSPVKEAVFQFPLRPRVRASLWEVGRPLGQAVGHVVPEGYPRVLLRVLEVRRALLDSDG